MQKASAAYKKAMKQPIRNRAYINARIGIVSSVAQNNVVADWDKNGFACSQTTQNHLRKIRWKDDMQRVNRISRIWTGACIFCRRREATTSITTTDW